MEDLSYISTILGLVLDGGEWLASHSGRFTPEERAHCIRGSVGSIVGLGAVE
jgi:hypothetical protein